MSVGVPEHDEEIVNEGGTDEHGRTNENGRTKGTEKSEFRLPRLTHGFFQGYSDTDPPSRLERLRLRVEEALSAMPQEEYENEQLQIKLLPSPQGDAHIFAPSTYTYLQRKLNEFAAFSPEQKLKNLDQFHELFALHALLELRYTIRRVTIVLKALIRQARQLRSDGAQRVKLDEHVANMEKAVRKVVREYEYRFSDFPEMEVPHSGPVLEEEMHPHPQPNERQESSGVVQVGGRPAEKRRDFADDGARRFSARPTDPTTERRVTMTGGNEDDEGNTVQEQEDGEQADAGGAQETEDDGMFLANSSDTHSQMCRVRDSLEDKYFPKLRARFQKLQTLLLTLERQPGELLSTLMKGGDDVNNNQQMGNDPDGNPSKEDWYSTLFNAVLTQVKEVFLKLRDHVHGYIEMVNKKLGKCSCLTKEAQNEKTRQEQRQLRDLQTEVDEKKKHDIQQEFEKRQRDKNKDTELTSKSELLFGIFKLDFILLYLFKVLRFGIQIICVYFAQKAFEETYVSSVYAEKNKPPPPLHNMLLMFLSFDAVIQVILFIMILAASFIYKRPGNTFIIDDDFISLLLTENILNTVLTLGVGWLIAAVMKQKKYFGYKKQGITTSAAYRDMLAAVVAVMAVIPFTVVFDGIFS